MRPTGRGPFKPNLNYTESRKNMPGGSTIQWVRERFVVLGTSCLFDVGSSLYNRRASLQRHVRS